MSDSNVPAIRDHAALTTTDPSGAFLATLEERWRLAKYIAASGLVPYRKPEPIIAIMLKAHELGVPPMQAFGSIHFFDGKLILESSLMDGIAATRLGVRKKILEWTDKVCRIQYSRQSWEPVVATFTIDEARNAGLLNKDNWKKYPKDMLAARAKARGLRMIAPDFFAGSYAVEEMDGVPRYSDDPGGLDDLKERLGTGVDTQSVEPASPPVQDDADTAPVPAEEDAAELPEPAHGMNKVLKDSKGNPTLWVCICGKPFKSEETFNYHLNRVS